MVRFFQRLGVVFFAAASFSAPALAAAPKVLVVMSGADEVRLTGGHILKTGYFLRELAEPLAELTAAGFDVTFTSPEGKRPTMDEFSKELVWYTYPSPLEARALRNRLLETVRAQLRVDREGSLAHPVKLESLTERDLAGFAAVFVPGGHAPVADLVNSPDMARVLTHFHDAKKPTALICHAPIALLSTHEAGKPWIYAGYHIAVATTTEERVMERIGPMAPHQLSFTVRGREWHYVDAPLAAAGAILHPNPVPSMPKVMHHKELITGQNPASALELGRALVQSVRASGMAGLRALQAMTLADLAKTFADAAPAGQLEIPNGDGIGIPLLVSGVETVVPFVEGDTLNSFASLFWGGKVFHTEPGAREGWLQNKLLSGTNPRSGLQLIRARVYQGNVAHELGLAANATVRSLVPGQAGVTVDGKDSILLDYRVSATPLTQSILDEIRPVLTDKYKKLYLGRAFVRQGRFWCYFALQFE